MKNNIDENLKDNNRFVKTDNGYMSKDILFNLNLYWTYMLIPIALGLFGIGVLETLFNSLDFDRIIFFIGFGSIFSLFISYNVIIDSKKYSDNMILNIKSEIVFNNAYQERLIHLYKVCIILTIAMLVYYLLDFYIFIIEKDFNNLNLSNGTVVLLILFLIINTIYKTRNEIKDAKSKIK